MYGTIPVTVPQNSPGQALKNVVSGVIMNIGNIFGGLMGGPSEPWFTDPSGENPALWKHDPENNRAMATFGAGCYWGTEKFFCTDFAAKYPKGAIIGTSVGFMSPDPNAMKNPNYREVCSG